jgi:dTDP-4-amino-4,6-dideoxygalactose transaminase
MALNDFEAGDEVITTPFSFPATTSVISWTKLKPVFCDIDENYFFIDVDEIEKKRTRKTKAVLVTHIYGNTGNLEFLSTYCKDNNLRLICDAAHAFGVKYKNESILKYGDINVLSFHATKTFHTVEGGAIYCKEDKMDNLMRLKKNFGYDNYEIKEIGINSKISEFHAGMRLVVLKHMPKIIENRKQIFEAYNLHLNNILNLKIKPIQLNNDCNWNYAYYPILFEKEEILLKVKDFLATKEIYARRYFHPCLSNICYTNSNNTPIAQSVSERILCLPMYYGLDLNQVELISKLIIGCF